MSSEAVTRSELPREQQEIIRKNISAIAEVQLEEHAGRSLPDRASDSITAFSGSMIFVILHAAWFGVWILLNVGLIHIPRVSEFDPFPFGLLTMIVSLEAIFLSTFVLISQNRMAKLSEQRAELDLHINLLAEQKATKVLELLNQMTKQLNTLKRFNFEVDPEVEALQRSPEPQEVLQVMKETVEQKTEEVKKEVAEKVREEVKEEIGKAVDEITGETEAVRAEVKDITGETRAVRADVESVKEKVSAVATDIEEIKEQVEKR